MSKLIEGNTYTSICSDCQVPVEFKVTRVRSYSYEYKIIGGHKCSWFRSCQYDGLSLTGGMALKAKLKLSIIRLK